MKMNSTLCSKTWDGWRIPTKSWDEDFKFFGMKGSKSLRWRVQKASKALFKDFGWGVQSRWEEGLNNWFKDLGWTGFWNDESSKALFNYIYILEMKGSKSLGWRVPKIFQWLGMKVLSLWDQTGSKPLINDFESRVQRLWGDGFKVFGMKGCI